MKVLRDEIERRLESAREKHARFQRAPRWSTSNRNGLTQDDCVRIQSGLEHSIRTLESLLAWADKQTETN